MTKRLTYTITGIHCEGCVHLVKEIVQDFAFAENALVNKETNQLIVDVSSDVDPPIIQQQIKAKLQKHGYFLVTE